MFAFVPQRETAFEIDRRDEEVLRLLSRHLRGDRQQEDQGRRGGVDAGAQRGGERVRAVREAELRDAEGRHQEPRASHEAAGRAVLRPEEEARGRRQRCRVRYIII